MKMQPRTICLVAIATVLLASCSIPDFEERDSGPSGPVDVSKVPNAVPKHEPKSRGGNPKSYVVFGKRYHPMKSARDYKERGIASWYGNKFHGRRTSNGEVYDMYAMSAAHKTLPLPTYVRVTNLKNGRWVIVRVNDRGPFHENRIIDLSYTAAAKLGIHRNGTGLVEVEAVYPGSRPASPPPPPSPPTVVATRGSAASAPVSLYIQVGAFQNQDNALRLKTRLHSLFKAGIQIHEFEQPGNRVYRVRVGPLDDVESADRLVERLAEVGLENARIIVD